MPESHTPNNLYDKSNFGKQQCNVKTIYIASSLRMQSRKRFNNNKCKKRYDEWRTNTIKIKRATAKYS